MKIVIDAFGGDNAPLEIIKGAALAQSEYGVDIILTGDEQTINNCINENNITFKSLEIVHAPDVISMHDEPTSLLKAHKDSSMAVAFRLLADGKADAFVSAGSTGAIVVGGTLIVKRIKGIKRPALGSMIPSPDSSYFLMDMGANAECRPEMLAQFGVMASVYLEKVENRSNPTIGLLNIGTEDTKGTPLQKEAYALLTAAAEKGILNFVGNVEARDVPLGAVDVVVCDGFSGNVLLKSIEGTAMFMGSLMKHKIFKRNFASVIGYLFCKKGVDEVMKMMDYREIGGTQFLGIKKPVIKAHGSSDALAFRNAVKQAMDAANSDITAELEEGLKALNKENTDDQ